jgi:hypothetical protein
MTFIFPQPQAWKIIMDICIFLLLLVGEATNKQEKVVVNKQYVFIVAILEVEQL